MTNGWFGRYGTGGRPIYGSFRPPAVPCADGFGRAARGHRTPRVVIAGREAYLRRGS